LPSNQWVHLIVTGHTMTENNLFTVGSRYNIPTNAFDGEMADFRVYSGTLSATQVSALYKEYAKLPYFIDELQDANESVAANSGAFLENTDWRIYSGAFKISRDETLGVGQKVIECTTAGTLYQESNQAYGTWEFDLYKGSESSIPYVYFCSQAAGAANGDYDLEINNDESVRLRERASTNHFVTAASYVAIQTWYKFRITRRYDGQFTVYIKGGAFTNWTLVDPSGGSGSNPVTDNTLKTSSYVNLDLDTSDKIANMKFYNGVLAI